ncbi:DNA-binding transcriptional regulator, PadR family [Limimonas halophila]|uniref:DNA-binding transcriptional regulator, PadR family n=1 Tax=Limimonas halophila TaxID=1082479 RepID=A0A1G7KZ91_9PROT|nr:PadR family transcriptional regulator [Limimonas halophila]SDF42404.1 DNA-binding transcriptional regulator, PadR family [Limimonas halophila]
MNTRTLCLGVLTLGDATGYDITKRFERSFKHFMAVSQAAIYPALRDLNAEGLVTCTRVEQEDRPARKVYSITDAGRRALTDALVATPPRHDVRSDFIALVFFGHLLPQDKLVATLDQQLEDFETRIATCRAWLADGHGHDMPAGMRFAAGFGITVLSAACAYIRENRHMLEHPAAPRPEDAAE